MNEQIELKVSENYIEIDNYLKNNNIQKLMLVCGKSISALKINDYFNSLTERIGIEIVKFSDFQPNPTYESVVKGVQIFGKEKCQSIIAVGGGSAIDVAKCIKLFSNMNHSINYLKQSIVTNDVKLLAIPTTAGTGTEVTKYAVIYYKGEKQSISHWSCIPGVILYDVSVLNTLPKYQRKSTMMDALCHAIESFWSVNSNEESQEYSRAAIKLILDNKDAYLSNEENGNANMMYAANLAGKAINITQTTAGHAMCYKMTSLYGISHGHAAALCVNKLFPYMINNLEKCIDPRGKKFLGNIFEQIASAMGCVSVNDATNKFSQILVELELCPPMPRDEHYSMLIESVNLMRIKNNPIDIDENGLDILYHNILEEK